MDKIYHSFDSSDFLFENMWKLFPTIISNNNLNNTKEIIERLLISSEDFCDFNKKKIFKILPFSEGSFGVVGLPKIKQKVMFTSVYSYGKNRGSSVFDMKVITKQSKQNIKNEILKISKNIISITDPLSDMVFGCAKSHLYDIGVYPFTSKYFGTYVCKNNNTSMITEMNDHELYKVLNRNNNIWLDAEEFRCILVQFLYAMFISKHYYGSVHFDSHLRNLMLLDLPKNPNYMYHAKTLVKTKLFLMRVGNANFKTPIYVAFKTPKYILKMIDYGCMMMCLDRSKVDRYTRNIKIETNQKDITLIGAYEALINSRENSSYANTVDVMFTILNMYNYMYLNLDNYNKKFRTFKNHLKVLDNVSEMLVGVPMDEFINTNKQFRVKEDKNGVKEWFMRNHSTGMIDESRFDKPDYLLTIILRLFSGYKQAMLDSNNELTLDDPNGNIMLAYFDEDLEMIESLKEEEYLLLDHESTTYQNMFNRMEFLIENENKCIKSKNKKGSIHCQIMDLFDQRSEEFFNNDKDWVTPTWFQEYNNKNINIYFRSITSPETPVYQKFNNWNNMQPMQEDLINQKMHEVRVYAIMLNEKTISGLTTDNPILETNGISLPIGLYAIFNSKALPLGFFASKQTNTITYRHIPSFYHEYIGVVLCKKDNSIVFERYNDFVDRHVTTKELKNIDVDSKEETQVIQTNPLKLKSGDPYIWAVTCGPVLVWENKIVFTYDIAMNSKSPVPIYEGDSLLRLFDGSTPGYYQLNDSLTIQSQLIFVVGQSGTGFVFIEGGGSLSPGIDRPTAAKFCINIGASYAVCVASGYSANILIQNLSSSPGITGTTNRYLGKSHIRLTHGCVLNIKL